MQPTPFLVFYSLRTQRVERASVFNLVVSSFKVTFYLLRAAFLKSIGDKNIPSTEFRRYNLSIYPAMPVKKPVTLDFKTTTSVIFPLFGQRREQPARFL